MPHQSDPLDTILTPIAYGAGGAAFGFVQFFNSRKQNEPLRWDQLIKTVAVWFIAGVVVYENPGDFSQAAVASAALGLAPFVNIALDQLLPGGAGGSPNRGVGAKRSSTST